VFNGEVESIVTRGVPSGGITTYPVNILLEGDPRLYMGMNCNVTLVINQVDQAFVVPLSAISYREPDGRPIVRVLHNDRVSEVAVGLGMMTHSFVQLTDGVGLGDEIIIGEVTTQDMPQLFRFGGQ
jgi:multidrug efflux pump subunit AcrA (membrane-fusion protein)